MSRLKLKRPADSHTQEHVILLTTRLRGALEVSKQTNFEKVVSNMAL